jgi:hypothetical protein
VAALATYNAAYPDHALALFLEGGQRLDRDDEQGLALLERAMALDADAIKPGCERAFRYLTDRNDPRADNYQTRWHAREGWEQERQLQIDVLRGDDTLMAADLDAAAMALLRERLLAHGSQVAQAWIARRVIAADPAVRCFVLGVNASTWARWRRKDKPLLHALAALEWPFALHVCLLNGQYKGLRKQFEQLTDAQLT